MFEKLRSSSVGQDYPVILREYKTAKGEIGVYSNQSLGEDDDTLTGIILVGTTVEGEFRVYGLGWDNANDLQMWLTSYDFVLKATEAVSYGATLHTHVQYGSRITDRDLPADFPTPFEPIMTQESIP